jgi:hypothetical protein
VIGQTGWRRNRWRGRRSYRIQRSERDWIGAFASASGSIMLVAGSARFSRRVCEQNNRPSSTHVNPSWQTSSSSTESRHRRVFLFTNPIHHGNSFSVCSSPQPRFALILWIFLMPAIPLPGYRC